MMDEEIRQALNEVREMKQMCGNINMKLTNIVTQRGQDCKKKLEAEYQRGLNDAWEAASNISILESNGGYSWKEMNNIFGTDSPSEIYMRHTAAEAINKIKAYEEKQKADNRIEVGDEVNWLGDCFIVTRIFQSRNMKEQCDGIDDDGCVYHDVLIKDLEKTGRHFDILSILEAMKHD